MQIVSQSSSPIISTWPHWCPLGSKWRRIPFASGNPQNSLYYTKYASHINYFFVFSVLQCSEDDTYFLLTLFNVSAMKMNVLSCSELFWLSAGMILAYGRPVSHVHLLCKPFNSDLCLSPVPVLVYSSVSQGYWSLEGCSGFGSPACVLWALTRWRSSSTALKSKLLSPLIEIRAKHGTEKDARLFAIYKLIRLLDTFWLTQRPMWLL